MVATFLQKLPKPFPFSLSAEFSPVRPEIYRPPKLKGVCRIIIAVASVKCHSSSRSGVFSSKLYPSDGFTVGVRSGDHIGHKTEPFRPVNGFG